MLRSHSFPVLSLFVLTALGACRAPHVPATASTGCHPACAGATTAAVGDASAGLRGEASLPATALVLEAQALAVSPKAYLCPMHLHVGADEPGRCPECNMKLVPRSQALEHDHDQ